MPLIAAALVVLVDRLSKDYINHTMSAFDSISIIPGLLRIVHTENPGAAFGFLANGNPIVRGAVLIGVSVIVLYFVAAALWGRNSSFTSAATRFGLALILGGALGNLYDRAVHRTVTDFIEIYSGTWLFPAFNVADSAITIGACLLILDLLRPKKKIDHVPEAH